MNEALDYGYTTTRDLRLDGRGSLRWTAQQREIKEYRYRAVLPPQLVFPPSIAPSPVPPFVKASNYNLLQSAEDYLDRVAPDFAFPASCLLPALQRQQHFAKHEATEENMGSRIAACALPETTDKAAGFGRAAAIAFAGGVDADQLYIAPFERPGWQHGGKLTANTALPKLLFSAKPAFTFNTPIQHIEMQPAKNASMALAVRTIDGTHLAEVALPSRKADVLPEHRPIVSLPVSETSKRHAAVCVSPFEQSRALVVDQEGAVWDFDARHDWLKTSNRNLFRVQSADGRPAGFRRITFGATYDLAVRANEETVQLIDMRAGSDRVLFSKDDASKPSRIYDLCHSGLFSPSSSGIHCLVNATHVIWLDERKPGTAVLEWAHHRSHPSSLQLHELAMAPDAEADFRTYTLTSRRDGLRTLFTTSTGLDEPLVSMHSPYAIEGRSTKTGAICGTASLAMPAGTILFDSAANGSVWHQVVAATGDEDVIEVDKDVERCVLDEVEEREIPRLLSFRDARRGKVVNAYKLFSDVFLASDSPSVESEEISRSAREAAETLREAPEEAMLTLHDLVAGDAPAFSSRSLASILQPTALDQLDSLRLTVAAGLAYSPVLSLKRDMAAQIFPDAPAEFSDLAQVANRLRERYGIPPLPDMDVDGGDLSLDHRESLACDQLALDLALASSGFRPTATAAIEKSNESTVLNGVLEEPEGIDFGWFRPKAKKGRATVDTRTSRLLLSEWKLGADPKEATYVEPYGVKEAVEAQQEQPVEFYIPQSQPLPAYIPSQKQRTATPASQPPAFTKPKKPTRLPTEDGNMNSPASQPFRPFSQATTATMAQPESQESAFVQSQVLPGVHGGRGPPPAKKKKRAAGF